jgi:hypothetical protein
MRHARVKRLKDAVFYPLFGVVVAIGVALVAAFVWRWVS